MKHTESKQKNTMEALASFGYKNTMAVNQLLHPSTFILAEDID